MSFEVKNQIGPPRFLVFFEELRGHWLAVAFLDAGQAQHDGAVALECLPEFGFDIGLVCP